MTCALPHHEKQATRYTMPHSQLPFVNSVIIWIDCAGMPYLVSSVWDAPNNAHLFFRNPDTRALFSRPLAHGAYKLQLDTDGKRDIRCDNGRLARYNGTTDTMALISSNELNKICWGGCMCDSFVLWCAHNRDGDTLPAMEFGQMQSHHLVHDGSDIWRVTGPAYGTLCGARCRLDSVSGAVHIWANLSADQTLYSVIFDTDSRHRYPATTIHAENHSAPPQTATAQLHAFDMNTLTITAHSSINDHAETTNQMRAPLDNNDVLVKHNEMSRACSPKSATWTIVTDDLPAHFGFVFSGPHGPRLGVTVFDVNVMVHYDPILTCAPNVETAGTPHIHCASDTLYGAYGSDIVTLSVAALDVEPNDSFIPCS